MKDFKATFYYKNGDMIREDTPSIEGLAVHETIPMVSTVEGIKFGLSPVAHSHKINGQIEISVANEKLYVVYHIDPDEAKKHLQEAVARFYTVDEK